MIYLNNKYLAAALGLSEGVAYIRKYYAIARLRQDYNQANSNYQEANHL